VKVLATVDGSKIGDRVLPVLAQLVLGAQASVALLGVRDPDHEDIDQVLEGRLRELAEGGIGAEVLCSSGEIVPSILSHIASLNADLLLMATHGRSGLSRALLGSVAQAVIRASPIAVVLVSPHASLMGQPRTLILPVDGSEVSERAVSVASSLARWLGATAKVIQVVVSHARLPGDIAETNYVENVARRVKSSLPSDWDVLHGDPAEEILAAAAHESPSLVVMSTHGRTGFGRTILGSVADTIVRNASVPVVAIGPSFGSF
jgi:nucleotide-binding universal stress UspA family protein